MSTKNKHWFTGAAVGAAGVNFKNTRNRDIFPVKASVSLPVIGGVARARCRKFRVADLISFDRARTEAIGRYEASNDTFRTQANATVENVKVGKDFFGAETVRAGLISYRQAYSDEEYPIVLDRPVLKLSLYGHALDVDINESIMGVSTSDEVKRVLETSDDVRIRELDGYFYYSLVTRISWRDPKIAECFPGVSFHGHRIDVEDFGSIFLAELVRGCRSARLTMIRIKWDDESKGEKEYGHTISSKTTYKFGYREAIFSDVESNGMRPPP